MARCEVYRFGPFTLDVGERQLTEGDRALGLAPKAFDVLVALVAEAGHLVTKDELLRRVWPAAFVDEGILTVHISALRKALGDDTRRPWCIETVPRTGYRFIARLENGSGAPVRRPAAAAAENYELVGRGRFYLLSASRRDVPQALAAYGAAIERDPTYAAAHAGLAMAHCAQAELRLAPPAEAYAHARESALRALAMDSGCADAQVALGIVLFLGDWNWIGAERSFQRALRLNPDHTEAYLLYGRLLEALGRLPEGLEMKLKALARDPFSPIVHIQIAHSYWHQRQYDQVIEWANRTLALDPDHVLAREYVAGAYFKKADLDRHMAECDIHARAAGTSAAMAPIAEAYVSGGRLAAVRELLARADTAGGQPIPEMQRAILHAEVGEMDQAFEHLDAAIDSRDPCLVHLAVAPQWDALRADPRFASRLDRMGLSESVPVRFA